MLKSFDRYLLRAIFTPLISTLVIAVMLLLLDEMLRLFDFLLDQNGPVRLVWEMLANLLPEYLVLALPIGFFLGVQLAFRGFSLSSELDAVSSTGVSLMRLARPVYGAGLLLMAINILIVGFIQPYTAYRYSRLGYEVQSGALSAQVRTGEFIQIGDGVTIRIGRILDGARKVGDIFIQRCDKKDDCIIATAREGAFLRTDDDRKLVLRLFDSRQIEMTPQGPKERALIFTTQDIPVDLPKLGAFRPRGRGGEEEEATLFELIDVVMHGKPHSSAQYDLYRAALHWRTLHSLLFLVLPLMAISLGIVDKRRDFGAGLVVGLALVIVYYETIQAGERQVANGLASPWVAMWPALVLFTAISVMWFRAAALKPGARALSGLEATIGAVGGAMRLVMRRLGARRA